MPEESRREIGRRAEELRARGHERLHLLVQLHEIPSPGGRDELARRGLDLGTFVPGSAFIAAVPVGLAVAAVVHPEVRWATLWTAGHKLHPRVESGDWAPWVRHPDRPGLVAVMLLLHHDVPLTAGDGLAERHGGVAMPPVEGLHGMTIWLPQEKVAELAQEEEVLWIEEAPPPLSATNDGVRAGMRSDGLAASPYGLDGSGVRLFVFDVGTVSRSHETFDPGTGSRVTLVDGRPVASHSTHVAGTAAGDGSGSVGGRGRGVAPGASILSAGYERPTNGTSFWDTAGDLETDYALARNTHGADIGNNSIGSNTANSGFQCEIEGDYGAASSLVDGIVSGVNPAVGGPVFMTWGAGNERNARDASDLFGSSGRCGSNYGTMPPPACSKNPIQVGAVNSDGLSMTEFSSWGPCDDGRLQPTLVAPGCETGLVTGESTVHSSIATTSNSAYGGLCGTSMAAPAVAGVASLLVQDWRAQGHGGPNDRPSPALLKALLIHTAHDLGPEGPDYTYGYGSVDAKAAVDLLRGDDVLLGGWTTGTVGQGLVEALSLDGPLVPLDEIKVTLVWDDPPAAPFAAEALVNDLSLEVSGTSGSHQPLVLAPASPHLPATTGIDSRNNVEQVVIRDPSTASDWLVRIAGTRVPQGPQSYALVYSFEPATGDRAACTLTTAGFELGTDGWTLSGDSAHTAAPAAGHGATSLRLGSGTDTSGEATRQVVVPTESRTELSFWWYMTTEESLDLFGFGFDPFTVEIRDSAGAVLAVVDWRNDGWPEDTWMPPSRIDLSPWAGQAVTIAFTASNDFENVTTFWVDDIVIESCPRTSSGIGPWQSADIGAVGIAGSATLAGGTVTIEAGGTALWDASDAFHYVYQPLTGDGEIVARVASLTVPTGANSTLGGVMIREQLTADSIHASMIITTQGKAKFRRRVTVGGMTLSDGPSTSTTFPPRWLKLSRTGDDFTASISDDGVTWTQVHTTQTVPMAETVYIGLMALRDGAGAPACTATFENVSVRHLPSPWQNADVGPVGTAGRASHSDGIFTIEAGGTVLFDTSDAFHYVYQPLNGDGEIVVNLTGLTVPAGAESSMAAVMIREKLTESSVHASMMITTAGKAKFRRRVTEGGTTLSDGPTIGTLFPPRWLRLTRSGDTFTAYMSSDGSSWTQIHTPVTVAMPANVHIGFMALRSGGTGTTTATLRDVSVVP